DSGFTPQRGGQLRTLAFLLQRGDSHLRVAQHFSIAIDHGGTCTRLLPDLRCNICDLCISITVHASGKHLCLLGQVASDLLVERLAPEIFGCIDCRERSGGDHAQKGAKEDDERSAAISASGKGYICSTNVMAISSILFFLRSMRNSWPILPVHSRMRRALLTSGSGRTRRKLPLENSSIGDEASGCRSMLLGVNTTRGFRQGRSEIGRAHV